MQSQAKTVAAYLKELPPQRRALLTAVRKVLRANLDRGIEEVMNYGMIGYVIPHSIYPAGYHCDPQKPFPYAGLASQKNYCSLYLFPVYAEAEDWFRREWRAGGKKLDMGKCCVRFKQLADLDLDVLARALRRFTIAQTLQTYEQLLGARSKPKSGQVSSRKSSGQPKKPPPAAARGKPGAPLAKARPVASSGRRRSTTAAAQSKSKKVSQPQQKQSRR